MYNKNIKSFILLFVLINIIHGFISSRIPHSSFPRVDDKFIKTNIKQFNKYNKMNYINMIASDNAGNINRNLAKRTSEVLIESPSLNSRRITANIIVDGSIEDVWNILTDYDNLSTHIPNLVQSNRVRASDPNRIRLFQEGAQKIVGFDFRASLTMDMKEVYEDDGQAARERKIKFEHVESLMFSTFDGEWTLRLYSRSKGIDPSTGEQIWQYRTQLTYTVLVRPRGPVPVLALEWRIREDVPINLLAVKIAAEKLKYRNLRNDNNNNSNNNNGSGNKILERRSSSTSWEEDETLASYIDSGSNTNELPGENKTTGVEAGAGTRTKNSDSSKRGKVFRDAWGRIPGGRIPGARSGRFTSLLNPLNNTAKWGGGAGAL